MASVADVQLTLIETRKLEKLRMNSVRLNKSDARLPLEIQPVEVFSFQSSIYVIQHSATAFVNSRPLPTEAEIFNWPPPKFLFKTPALNFLVQSGACDDELLTYCKRDVDAVTRMQEHFSPEQQVIDASFRRYTEEKTAHSFATWLWIQNTWED